MEKIMATKNFYAVFENIEDVLKFIGVGEYSEAEVSEKEQTQKFKFRKLF